MQLLLKPRGGSDSGSHRASESMLFTMTAVHTLSIPRGPGQGWGLVLFVCLAPGTVWAEEGFSRICSDGQMHE